MPSVNKTHPLELSQFIGTDKPTYLDDYNGDMLKINDEVVSLRAADNALNDEVASLHAADSMHDTAITALQAGIDSKAAKAGTGSAVAFTASGKNVTFDQVARLSQESAWITVGPNETSYSDLGQWSFNKIPFVYSLSSQGNFTLQNNSIVVGAGISKVKISASIVTRNPATAPASMEIQLTKNNSIVVQSFFTSTAQAPFYSFSSHITPVIINVAQGDVIQLGLVPDTLLGLTLLNSTRITVEKVVS